MLGMAVLGAGRIGKIHAANIALNRNARLVAVADPFEGAAATLAADLGAIALHNATEAIEHKDVQAVVICTPTPTHVELLLHAAALGKAVLCEKPVDLDIARADQAVQEVERLGAKVMVAFNRRFDPTAERLRKAIDSGEIGDVRQVMITSRDPGLASRDYLRTSGGIFRDMTIHDFDMARWLLGEEPIEVLAFGSRLVDGTLAEFNDHDTVMVQMRTASGKQCHINCCRQSIYGYDQRFEIFGSKGMVLNENLRANTIRRWNGEHTEAREPLLDFFLERYQDAYRVELEVFVNAILNDRPLPVTLRDGRQALRLADCAAESAETGCAVGV